MSTRIGRLFKDLFTTDTTEGAAEAAKATFELAEALDKDEIKKLVPIIEQGGSLLEVLNSPLAELAESTLPFVKVATGLLKFYVKVKQKEPTLVQEILLVSQAAYLESFTTFLSRRSKFRDWFKQRVNKPPSEVVKRQFKHLENLEVDHRTARIALVRFQDSALAQAFNEALAVRLADLGLPPNHIDVVTNQVAADTNQYILTALAEMGDSAKRLLYWYQTGGQAVFEKYLSIDEYLEQEVRSKPDETIFDETQITFRHLYVPLQVKQLDDNGNSITAAKPIDLKQWVLSMLTALDKQQQVLFIQGEAGRGKSVFCRMFSDRLSRNVSTLFVPIVVRLRHLRVLENNLTQTLENYLQAWDFVTSDPSWLTDKNTRFLFLLDGFDELLLEGRISGGLKEFLQQVELFQRQSHHRFLITGRPLALQGIDRLITQTKCLERVELQPMSDQQQQIWLDKWQQKVGELEVSQFQQFLQACPEDVREKLAREPLLLYLLARLHREEQLNVQMFEGTAGIQAKIRIYDEAVKWVLEKQRQNENLRLTGLEPEDLRRVLTEAALCVVQPGNETAKVTMLETRLRETNNPVAGLIQQARQETAISDDRTLNNLLTTFYLKPASGDKGGAVEFAHKSFSEFLFAERLKEAIEDWSKPGDKRRGEFYVADKDLHWEIYDLLGYGGLTPEIVEYLMGLLDRYQEVDWIRLFKRLEDFYIRWCEGEFIDADPPTLPQQKMLKMRETGGDWETQLGQRQVDVYAGLNVMILLLELHRYAKSKTQLSNIIAFYPCGQKDIETKVWIAFSEIDVDEDFAPLRLIRIINYSNSITTSTNRFNDIVRFFLYGIVLRSIDLRGIVLFQADLHEADLSYSDLGRANFTMSNLSRANLTDADLRGANLSGANLSGANLSGANLDSVKISSWFHQNEELYPGTNLSGANLHKADFSLTDLGEILWDENTNWEEVKGLETAVNVPEELKRQLGLIEEDEE